MTKKELDGAYYLANKEKIKVRTSEWNQKHRAYHRAYDKKWRAKNPTKSRASYLKRTYGLPLEEYELIKAIQDGRCAICLLKVKRLVVDHSHTTNKVRSLLCTTCNAGIGQFKDDVVLLANAISYLHRHEVASLTTRDSS